MTAALSCAAVAETPKNSLLTPDFSAQVEESEIIVVGRAGNYSPSKELLDRDYYAIQVKQILKPALAATAANAAAELADKSPLLASLKDKPLVLVLSNNIQSSLGTNPSIEPGKEYVFFLQVAQDDAVANGHISATLTNLWKGVVPLESASENRVLAGTLGGYEVDILKNPAAFIQAIGLATGSTPQASADKEAVQIAQKLGLQPAVP